MKRNQPSIWQAISDHASSLSAQHLRELFVADPSRFDRFSLNYDGLLLDYSKQRVTSETLSLLHQYAHEIDIEGHKQHMFNGGLINHTENRAVRHVSLRSAHDAPTEVKLVLDRMKQFCKDIHSGIWRGYSGRRITDIVNIGIGGSDLGPRMAVQALASAKSSDLKLHFVSNIDSADILTVLAQIDPESSLFIVSSKTFSTHETLINAQTAKEWMLSRAGNLDFVPQHFVAISSNVELTKNFGIPPSNVFELWDWVGGRFSLWSAIGLSIALAIGWRNFEQLLAGACSMDEHFYNAPPESNLPLTLALLSFWNVSFLGAISEVILPYSHSLNLFPAYLQQLEMESLGKQVDVSGQAVTTPTCPIIWGASGTNGQHSFYQMLHQGGRFIPSDFIAVRDADFPMDRHHNSLLANCLAQSAALAFGQSSQEAREAGVPDSLVPFKTFPGNQPSSTLILSKIEPYTLGQLCALFEHKVFCLGVLWNINAFDQWGVELGKQLASKLLPYLEAKEATNAFDSSTEGLIAALCK